MDAPEDQPAGVVCAQCGRVLDLNSPDTTRLALLRDWDGDEGVPSWDGAVEDLFFEGEWTIRCVRPFCGPDHARAWMAAGHPLPDEWKRSIAQPSPDLGFDFGCFVVLVVLFLLACLVILGAAEAWRIIF
ncbi:hypothetical protein QE364_002229 [Nocardioides zeae]|uniref:Uncharacterized protein n=1 Tax=Nocardioides zeae TaxID=1457234 RepID=A0ACC6IIL6_9ACTN|nr:hypothetical protein [Nocardioides zeae]MDR6176371.1 hypothetical protein [Nocardioides zeae]MDR6210518.1 hypothetical protein [Nocardioides zeae]